MRLSEKGPVKKPPVLKGSAQEVSLEIQSWARVISATHWTIGDTTKVNGADFYVAESELGHIHLDGEMHLRIPRKLGKSLIAAKLADPFPWGNDWVQFQIKNESSAAHAKWLFQLGYDVLTGATQEKLEQRISKKVL